MTTILKKIHYWSCLSKFWKVFWEGGCLGNSSHLPFCTEPWKARLRTLTIFNKKSTVVMRTFSIFKSYFLGQYFWWTDVLISCWKQSHLVIKYYQINSVRKNYIMTCLILQLPIQYPTKSLIEQLMHVLWSYWKIINHIFLAELRFLLL